MFLDFIVWISRIAMYLLLGGRCASGGPALVLPIVNNLFLIIRY